MSWARELTPGGGIVHARLVGAAWALIAVLFAARLVEHPLASIVVVSGVMTAAASLVLAADAYHAQRKAADHVS